MSKDRKFIAKGTTRNRHLVRTDDVNDKKRLITYSSEGRANAGFNGPYFYTHQLSEEDRVIAKDPKNLEAVKVEMIIKEVK